MSVGSVLWSSGAGSLSQQSTWTGFLALPFSDSPCGNSLSSIGGSGGAAGARAQGFQSPRAARGRAVLVEQQILAALGDLLGFPRDLWEKEPDLKNCKACQELQQQSDVHCLGFSVVGLGQAVLHLFSPLPYSLLARHQQQEGLQKLHHSGPEAL